MAASVTDIRSNPDEQIGHAAERLAGSEHRQMVFDAIYEGKKKVKTRSDIEKKTGLNNKQVLNAGRYLADNDLVSQEKVDGETAYRKYDYFSRHKKRILAAARDSKKLAKIPRNSQTRSAKESITTIAVRVPAALKPPILVTIDDIDSFKAVRDVDSPSALRVELAEETVKLGVKEILGDAGNFKDWGGEKNDLSTTRLLVKGRRRRAVFAFKGRAMKGPLTPGKMGKNGDQIQRLFEEDAEVFMIQYVGPIKSSVLDQMAVYALHKALISGKQIRYGVIDGQDTTRLNIAYPKEFSGG